MNVSAPIRKIGDQRDDQRVLHERLTLLTAEPPVEGVERPDVSQNHSVLLVRCPASAAGGRRLDYVYLGFIAFGTSAPPAKGLVEAILSVRVPYPCGA